MFKRIAFRCGLSRRVPLGVMVLACFCGALQRGLRCLFAFAECSGEAHAAVLLALRSRLEARMSFLQGV
jgi:hypothetical protein